MKRILIIGATSAIAVCCARRLLEKDTHFYLIGRNIDKLQQIKLDLQILGAASVCFESVDLTDYAKHASLIDQIWLSLNEIDIVLIAHGSLPNQKACEHDPMLALNEISVNALSIISILTLIANKMTKQKKGIIAVLSSVAGDRGRPSNYVYGCAKAAVNTFCEGLRARLHKVGVHVLTVKPGFVNTPMIQGLKLPKPLIAEPQDIANDIVHAINKKKNNLYAPWYWAIIMRVIRSIPQFVFKRTSL